MRVRLRLRSRSIGDAAAIPVSLSVVCAPAAARHSFAVHFVGDRLAIRAMATNGAAVEPATA